MSIPSSLTPLFSTGSSAAAGYQVSRSLRFNSSDSGFCSRVAVTPTDATKFTLSFWIKRSKLGTEQTIMYAGVDSSNKMDFIRFTSGDVLELRQRRSNVDYVTTTAAIFRDCSAWYHVVYSWSSGTRTLYVNGVSQTFASNSTTTSTHYWQTSGVTQYLGRDNNEGGSPYAYGDFYLADIHFIDGQALTPSSFTEVSATTGQLLPKAYSGSYGTNGFYLQFADNSSNTAATLGKDTSGNSNNWTPNNLSVTAGAGNDSLVDTPTSYGTPDTGVGGEVRGNYATLNPLQLSGSNRITLSNGNLQGAGNSIYYGSAISTISVNSGKWYAEFTFTLASTFPLAGIIKTSPLSSTYQNSDDQLLGRTADAYGYRNDQNLYNNSSNSTYGASWTDGNAIGVALDLDAGTLTFYKNGVSQGQAASGLSGYYAIGCSVYSSAVCNANFGQRAFAYTAPSGFKALCDTNIPEGTITTSGTFTGNASADGPFVYLNGVPTAMTINSNSVTFGTHADKLSNGFKVRNSTSTYNVAGSNTFSVSTTGAKFKFSRAQPNP